jgi:hypothetical protein
VRTYRASDELILKGKNMKPCKWPREGKTCPVHDCTTMTFTTIEEYMVHWDDVHVSTVSERRCSVCRLTFCWTHHLVNHLAYRHGMSWHMARVLTLDALVVRLRKNKNCCSPGNITPPALLCRKFEPQNTQVLEIR